MDRVNLDAIVNHMTDGMIVIHPDGKVLFFNDIAKRYEGPNNKLLEIGGSIFDIVPREQRDLVRFLVKEIRTKKGVQRFEAEFKHPKGHTVFFETSYSPVFSEDGQLDQIFIISRDITPQKTFEKKTVELVRELSNLIETANAVIFGVDGRGYITEWNRECTQVTGYEKNDVYAQRIGFLVDETHTENFNGLLQTVSKGASVSNFEFQLKTKDDRKLSVLLNATPKVSSAGQVIGALFVGQDITELSAYRQSLEKKVRDHTRKLQEALQKEKELVDVRNKFVSIASHEFKIPLSAISSSVNYLKSKATLNKHEVEKLESINLHVTHMKSLLEDVLTIGKSEASKLKPTYQEIDLIAFLEGVMEEVGAGTQHTHRIVREFPESPVKISSDEKLLRNIFVNLLSNAIKFSPGKDEVWLRVIPERESVEISIRDFGIGIDSKDAKRVFEPFNRGSNTGNIKGTGLGLSIVKKAVEALEGELDVDSEVGQGTTFKIRLRTLKEHSNNHDFKNQSLVG
jgi:PAS domain S-box-containing protein